MIGDPSDGTEFPSYDTSFGQARLWYSQKLEPARPLFNTPFVARMHGPLEMRCLQGALDVVVDRHESLRTRIVDDDGVPRQHVDGTRVSIEVLDARTWTPAGTTQFIDAFAISPFDLRCGPLLRVTLVRTAAMSYLLLINAHHAVIDGWSFQILSRELSQTYAALAAGQAPELGELSVQYGDFAEWQRDVLGSGRFDDQRAFWRQELSQWPLELQIPIDSNRPAVRNSSCGAVPFALSVETVKQLRALARRLGGTVHMALMTAFQVFLSDLTGQERFTVGATVTGRRSAAVDELIGFFANTIALRADCSTTPSFTILFERVRRTALRAYENQDLPFDEIVRAVNPPRNSARTPLFQAILTFCPHPLAQLRLPGVEIDHMVLAPSGGAHTDIDLVMYDTGSTILSYLLYPSTLVERHRASKWVDAFNSVLARAIADPDAPVFAANRAIRTITPPKGASGEVVEPRASTATSELREVFEHIWASVLGHAPVSVEADFFSAGGDSLLAVRLLARIEVRTGTQLQLSEFIRVPTIAGLSHLYHGAEADRDPIVAATRKPTRASFGQHRMWFMQNMFPGSSTYNVPYAVRVRGSLDVELVRRAIGHVTARHEVLRTRLRSNADVLEQHVEDESRIEVGVSHLGDAWSGNHARSFVDSVISVPFDLSELPLIRLHVGRFGSDDQVLVIVMHHAVSDGWSFGVFARELSQLYNAYLTGDPIPLVPLTIQYGDFAEWQHNCLNSGQWGAQIAYWHSAHRDWPLLELPTDRPRPGTPSQAGASIAFTVPERVWDTVRAAARRLGGSVHMVAMTAFQTMLHRVSGQARFIVGTAVTGRTRASLGDSIGYFANTIPVKADFVGNPPPDEAFARVRRQLLMSYANQDVPLDRIVHELGRSGSPAVPLLSAVFTYGPQPLEGLELSGAVLEPFAVLPATARTDLTIELADGDRPTGILEYSTDLFVDCTAQRFIRTFLQELATWRP
ncbi:condensation domain-containing protein [Nocardia sp. NPDC057668]|uniref:condensation domain-containing protein n=1 Tax=Nocardia sp. NPDC057668 TaxID=3346202 RepID=UPI003670E12C